jgi:hypothetical protein
VWGQGGIAGQPAVLPGHLHLREVAEERVRQLERRGKGLLRKGMVRADPEKLDMQRLELGVIGLPGREVRRSRRREIDPVEL